MQEKFVVKTSKAFIKELDNLPAEVALEIVKRLKILEVAPLPFGKSLIKKLRGFTPPLYRLRVGEYRVLYRIIKNEVIVLKIIARKQLERELKRLMG